MKAVVQRVTASSVSVDGEIVGKIDKGLNVLLGVEEDDTEKDAEVLASKIAKMRIFEDENEKMNLSLKDIKGELLVVSQFTLCGDTKKGTRPSFDKAELPQKANELYEEFLKYAGTLVGVVEHGKFGAMMKVSLVNDGPVTFMIEK